MRPVCVTAPGRGGERVNGRRVSAQQQRARQRDLVGAHREATSPAPALLGPAVGLHAGERPDQRRFAVVDVPRLVHTYLPGDRLPHAVLDRAREGDATRIFIGAENNLFALSGSSVIAKPFRGSDGRVVGVVGVIGPTRLNYARVVPMVDFTAATLARLMS